MNCTSCCHEGDGRELYRTENRRIGPFLYERHSLGCECSYCNDLTTHARYSCGLWLPECKAWNSWRVLWMVGSTWRHYVRFLAFWKPRPRWKRGHP